MSARFSNWTYAGNSWPTEAAQEAGGVQRLLGICKEDQGCRRLCGGWSVRLRHMLTRTFRFEAVPCAIGIQHLLGCMECNTATINKHISVQSNRRTTATAPASLQPPPPPPTTTTSPSTTATTTATLSEFWASCGGLGQHSKTEQS